MKKILPLLLLLLVLPGCGRTSPCESLSGNWKFVGTFDNNQFLDMTQIPEIMEMYQFTRLELKHDGTFFFHDSLDYEGIIEEYQDPQVPFPTFRLTVKEYGTTNTVDGKKRQLREPYQGDPFLLIVPDSEKIMLRITDPLTFQALEIPFVFVREEG